MFELALRPPTGLLAQMNTSIGGGTSSAPAAATPEKPAASAPGVGPAATGTTETTVTTSAPASGPTPPPAQPQANPLGWGGIVPIILILGFLYVFLIRGQRKEEKRRKSLLTDLKKGDRVMTIGGMIAKVVNIDGDDVVLKIDEAANVKATYRKTAIQEVIDRDEKK